MGQNVWPDADIPAFRRDVSHFYDSTNAVAKVPHPLTRKFPVATSQTAAQVNSAAPISPGALRGVCRDARAAKARLAYVQPDGASRNTGTAQSLLM